MFQHFQTRLLASDGTGRGLAVARAEDAGMGGEVTRLLPNTALPFDPLFKYTYLCIYFFTHTLHPILPLLLRPEACR